MKEGDIVEGKVTAIKPYGAFVEVDGHKGLVHISEVMDGFVYDIVDFLSVGNTHRFKILAIDDEGRLSLSRKALQKEKKRVKIQLSAGFAPLAEKLPGWIRSWHEENNAKTRRNGDGHDDGHQT